MADNEQVTRILADFGYDATTYAISDLVGMSVDLTYVELTDSAQYGDGATFHGTVYIATPGHNAGETIKIRAYSKRPREVAELLVGDGAGGRAMLNPPVRVNITKQGNTVVLT